LTAVLTTVIALATTPRGLLASTAPANLATVVTHGLLGVTGTAMQTSALTMAPAAYVNAIRRLSAVVAVVLGRTLFGEADLGRRLAAALLACAGAACLLFARTWRTPPGGAAYAHERRVQEGPAWPVMRS